MNKINRDMSKDEIIKISESLVGRKFREIAKIANDANAKGSLGMLIEEEGFSYGINSDSSPDFPVAGIELKVTPYKENKNGTLSAKERLVLNIINYMKEVNVDFYNSSFWKKNENLLILFYKYIEGVEKGDYEITYQLLYNFPQEDLIIIKQDWETIVAKIRLGHAHEISEADTLYLAACTKGKNSLSVREQPYSDTDAKQRAYSLKSSYMTQLVRKYVAKHDVPNLLTLDELKQKKSFEMIIQDKIKVYYGKSQNELAELFGLNIRAKNVNELIVSKILGIKGRVSRTEEFLKANIEVKTIRVEENGSIKESMSFPAFKYGDIYQQKWEESDFYNLLFSTKFFFVIFYKKGEDYILHSIKLWNVPLIHINNEAKEVFNNTKELISLGRIIELIQPNQKVKTFFAGTSFNGKFHVRPHGTNKHDTYDLPVRDLLTGRTQHTKQCFWINSKYLETIIK